MSFVELGTLDAILGSIGTTGSTEVGPFTAGIQESMLPWAPEGSDFDLMNRALGAMFETVYGIVADFGSPDEPASYQAGWSVLLNPTLCAENYPELLPWLALFIGASVPIGTNANVALATILGEQGFQRGQGFAGSYTTSTGSSGGAIVAAAQSQLSGTQTVTLLERTNAAGNPDPYQFVLIVQTGQVVNAAALVAAVDAVKPAGVQFTLVQVTSWTIGQLETAYSTIAAVEAAFSSITALEGDVT